MTTPLEIVEKIAGLLARLHVAHHFTGSVASSWYGQPRATVDIDVVIEANEERLEALARALEPDFYVSREAIREAVEHHSSFNAISLDSPFKVDFFMVGDRPYDRVSFGRSVEHALDETGTRTVRLLSPEDAVLRKLEWFRRGGEVSEQQWRDVLGILVVRRETLDARYLQDWARELGLDDLLAKAGDQARGL